MEQIKYPKLKEIKQTMLKMVHKANVSHIGAGLSIVDILYVLYFKVANISKNNINDPNRDVVILSKGHSSVSLYSVLYHKGLLEESMIDNYSIDNGTLPCHIDKEKSPFFELSTGSLGHGLSVGVGMALAKKMNNNSGHVYVICGDGECNEGSVWEAIMYAATQKIDNLTLIIDFNHFQAFGSTNKVINQSNLEERLIAFGFDTHTINGHNFESIEQALRYRSSLKYQQKPVAIIANTIKGKGVSFMENTLEWHYKSPNDEQLKIALQEIEEKY